MKRFIIEEVVELARLKLCRAAHIRQIAGRLANADEISPAPAPGGAEVRRNIGIAAQAEVASVLRWHDELRNDVAADIQNVTQHMRVVGGDVILLLPRGTEPTARLHEELVDLDIRRKRALAKRARIGDFGIALKNTLQNRRHEARLKAVARAR